MTHRLNDLFRDNDPLISHCDNLPQPHNFWQIPLSRCYGHHITLPKPFLSNTTTLILDFHIIAILTINKYLIFYVYFHGYLYVNVRTNELSRLTFRMQNIGLGHNLIVSSFVVTDDVNVNQSGV